MCDPFAYRPIDLGTIRNGAVIYSADDINKIRFALGRVETPEDLKQLAAAKMRLHKENKTP